MPSAYICRFHLNVPSNQCLVATELDSLAEGGALGSNLPSILNSVSWHGSHIRAKQGTYVNKHLSGSEVGLGVQRGCPAIIRVWPLSSAKC